MNFQSVRFNSVGVVVSSQFTDATVRHHDVSVTCHRPCAGLETLSAQFMRLAKSHRVLRNASSTCVEASTVLEVIIIVHSRLSLARLLPADYCTLTVQHGMNNPLRWH